MVGDRRAQVRRLASTFACAAMLCASSSAVAGDPDTVVINFAGDVAYPFPWGGTDRIEAQKHLLFRQVQPILDTGAINFANIECPLTDTPATAKKKYPIRCQPHVLEYVTKAGFNLLSLANNHSVDAGAKGINDTIALLKKSSTKARPLWFGGTGANKQEAGRIIRFTVPGKNTIIAFIPVANTSGAGKVAGLHDKKLTTRIALAKQHADLVIVSVHHGPEYVHHPWRSTVRRFHQLVDAGADIVVGHHAHVVQGFEHYKHGFIFYNQGNFSFGSKTNRHMKHSARMYSTLGRVTFVKNKLLRVEIVPLYVNNKTRWTLRDETLPSRHAEPQLLAGAYAQFALDEFEQFSNKVPKGEPTSFVRVGDRMYADLGTETFDEALRKALIEQQTDEYKRGVLDHGLQPEPATAAQKRIKQRAGTPWSSPRKKSKSKKKKRARSTR